MYSEVLLEASQKPEHRKAKARGVGWTSETNPMCGDELALKIVIKNGRVVAATWAGQGCLVCCGAAEIMCEYLAGAKVATIKKMKMSEVYKLIGFRPTPSRETCALLSLQALKASFK